MAVEYGVVREHEHTGPEQGEETNGRDAGEAPDPGVEPRPDDARTEPDAGSRALARPGGPAAREAPTGAPRRSGTERDDEPVVFPAPRASAGDPDLTLDVGHVRLDELALELQTELGIQHLKIEAKSLDAELHLTADLGNVVSLVETAGRRTPEKVRKAAPGLVKGALKRARPGGDEPERQGDDDPGEDPGRDEEASRGDDASGAGKDGPSTGHGFRPELGALKTPAAALAGAAGTAAVAGALRNGGRGGPFRRRKSLVVRLSTPVGKTLAHAAGKVAERPEDAVRTLRRKVG